MAISRSTVDFITVAKLLGHEARRRGLVAPSFRTPPRLAGVQRTLRRHPTGAAVAVQVRGRPWPVVVSDMIEGIVATNRLQPPAADCLRTELWQAVGFDGPLLRVA